MKKLVLSFLFVTMGLLVSAQTNLSSTQCDDLKTTLINTVASIQTMHCRFVQQKTMTMLTEPIVSEGILYYAVPDKMRWEYTSPYQFALIVNGKQTIRIKDGKAEKLDTYQGRMYKGLADIIMGSASGKSLFDASLFDVELYDDGKCWKAEMTPKRRDMKRMFNLLVFRFNKQTQIIEQVDFVELNGDLTTIRFESILLNEAEDERVFNSF